METQSEKNERLVAFFIERWKAYARNTAATQIPVRDMHPFDRKYYLKRIEQLERVEEALEKETDRSVINMLRFKRVVIQKDFEELYRKSKNLPKRQGY